MSLANELPNCERNIEAGKICPEDLPVFEWRIICENGCFLVHPDDKTKADKKIKLFEDLQLECNQFELRLDESLAALDEMKNQRDGFQADVATLTTNYKNLERSRDFWKNKSEDQWQDIEVVGAVTIGVAGGLFLGFMAAWLKGLYP